jgi:ubiquitin C-terminal hydrolase
MSLAAFFPELCDGRQQDCHEYFTSLITKLLEDRTTSDSLRFHIAHSFECHFVTRIQCTKRLCILHARDRADQCYALSCPLRRTVQASVLGFFGTEQRSAHVQQPVGQREPCSHCGMADTLCPSVHFTDLPSCVIVHLKRFRMDLALQSAIKLCDTIDIEPLLLVRCMERTAPYVLRSIVFHHGSTLNNGHYTCLVYNELVSQWFHVNDAHCEVVNFKWSDPPVYVKQDAYMLFYTRAASS